MGKNYYLAYIGTNSVRGSRGIYSMCIDADTWEIRLLHTEQAFNTGSLALDIGKNRLYAANEGMTFRGYADGGVYAFETESDGKLKRLNGQRSFGQRTCCVAADAKGDNVYTCNFYQGTWSVFPVISQGLAPARLVVEPPEDAFVKALHCIAPIGERYVGVISLAETALVVYRASDGVRITSCSFPEYSFPRWLEVHGTFLYAMMQSAPGEIYVFEYRLENEKGLRHIQTIAVKDEKFEGMAATSTLHVTPNGKLLLAADRPSNTITVFLRKKDGRLERVDAIKLSGSGPRDFCISTDGKILVTALQQSDQICVHEVDYENAALIPRGEMFEVPSPAAVAVSGIWHCS